MAITHLRNRLESVGGRIFALYSEANNRHPALSYIIPLIITGFLGKTLGVYIEEYVTGTPYIM